MFVTRKIENPTEIKKPRKRWKKIMVSFFVLIFILIASYAAFVYASGMKIFDTGSLTSSPFFKKISGQNYTLKGEGDGRINILLLGNGGANHPGGQLTDSMMVLSIDPQNKTYAMLSIPRDLFVPIPKTKISKKINEVYSMGENQKKGSGGDFIKEVVGKILDLPIHYYVRVDFYGFRQLVDQVGGIDVYVEKAIYDPLFPDQNMKGYDPFKINAGNQHMAGDIALKFARSRETSNDFDRAARQQKIIQALREKVLAKGYLANPKNIIDLVGIIGDHVKTDFSPDEITALAKIIKELDTGKTVSKVLDNGADGELIADSSTGIYTLLPKDSSWEQIQRIAHELFTDPDLKRENAKIKVINCSSVVGQAAKLSDILKSYNYQIIGVTNGVASDKTIIYDYSQGKNPVTVAFLEKRLNVKSIKKSSPDPYNTADIAIVIGSNYKGFVKE